MNKTIKVIDLLNKIANEEEMPKKIKYADRIWEFFNRSYFSNYIDLFEDYLDNAIIESLNNEVEIIEESEQEIDIQAIEEISEQSEFGRDVKDTRAVRINELIRAVKQLDRKYKGEK